MITFIVGADKNINLIINGMSHSIPLTHPNYAKIYECVKSQDEKTLAALVDIPKQVAQISNGNVKIENGRVLYKGKESHTVVASKIMAFYREGLPMENLMKFLDRLMENPSKHAVEELYTFLELRGIPITPNGTFLGYKRLRADFTDCHTGSVDNSVGNTIEMPRNEVDDNWRTACSSGYHVGGLDYVRGFGGGSDPVVRVEVDPKDVVAVSQTEQKLRTCKYKVVGLLEKDEYMPDHYWAPQSDPDYDDEDYDEDYEDEDDEERCDNCGSSFCDGDCEDEDDDEI